MFTRAAFTCEDPKSAKIQSSHQCLFCPFKICMHKSCVKTCWWNQPFFGKNLTFNSQNCIWPFPPPKKKLNFRMEIFLLLQTQTQQIYPPHSQFSFKNLFESYVVTKTRNICLFTHLYSFNSTDSALSVIFFTRKHSCEKSRQKWKNSMSVWFLQLRVSITFVRTMLLLFLCSCFLCHFLNIEAKNTLLIIGKLVYLFRFIVIIESNWVCMNFCNNNFPGESLLNCNNNKHYQNWPN